MKKIILLVLVSALSVLFAACLCEAGPTVCELDDHCSESEVCCEGQCTPKESEDNCGSCGRVCPDPMYCIEFQRDFYGCNCPTIMCGAQCCPEGQECTQEGCQ